MKKWSLLGVLALIIAISCDLSQKEEKVLSPKEMMLEDYVVLVMKTKAFLTQLDHVSDIDALQAQFMEVRESFKKVGFMLNYVDPQFYKKELNGAPLPYLEPNAPELNVIQPKGLQVIDELLYADKPELEEVKKYTKRLHTRMEKYIPHLQRFNLKDRQVFESLRAGVLTISTLGITGFDTPGSANGIKDAQVQLSSMKRYLNYYEQYAKENTKGLIEKGLEAIDLGNQQLASADFDQFDRLKFMKEVSSPLYSLVYQIHTGLHVETRAEVDAHPMAINYDSEAIFDQDFLNVSFYSHLHKTEDTKEVKQLGKLLFFDPLLSGDKKRSCASCHHPDKAMTDGKATSPAFHNRQKLERNSPTIINSVYSMRYFWDMRAEKLQKQIEQVILSHVEFNNRFDLLIEELSTSTEYKELFEQAFPKVGSKISAYTITTSIAAYVSSLNSMDSPFDKYMRGEEEELAPQVKEGFNLFMGKAQCGTCHFAPVFNGTVPPFYQDSESEVLGVPHDFYDEDPGFDSDEGRFANGLPKERADIFKRSFKTPTVRNVELTAPFMHAGNMKTLEDVVEFYDQGGGIGMGLDIHNQTLPDAPLNLTKEEKAALVAFMKALTSLPQNMEPPVKLPATAKQQNRKIGGEY